jgi:nucleoside-diphosphate-sugar epimerase
MIQVIPGTVIGPSELITTSQEAKEKMDRMSKALLFNAPKPRYLFGLVHVEDCAAAHVNALDEDMVSDEELKKVDWLVAAGTSEAEKNGEEVWREVAEMVDREFRDEVERGVFEVGWDRVPINVPYRVDSKRTEGMVLGGKAMRGFAECVRQVAGWYSGLLEEEGKGKEA